MLFENFESFLQQKNLLVVNPKILLTVSGGIDSMVMMHLFHRKGVNCSVAHCNFQLRGDESDGDEQFVRTQANQLGFPLFVIHFETLRYAEENHVSIQMAARELRYSWFNKLLKDHTLDHIAVAHNKDDTLETFFINLSRGTGIAGLTGINAKSEHIIRPLLFAGREDIISYARSQAIDYREDSSNSSDKYLRNYIRHHILPSLQQATPHFREALSQCMENLHDVSLVYENSVNVLTKSIVSHEKDAISIDIVKLMATVSPKTILYELLKPYQFPNGIISEILHSVSGISGKQFFSPTHRLVKDREKFLIVRHNASKFFIYYLEKDITALKEPIGLTIDYFEKPREYAFEKVNSTALFDLDKLEFPLMIRKWQMGDYFMPLGMNGMKKLSDFFIDQKMSLTAKENIWLLISGGHIIWIIGRRIDDRYKITDHTREICRIQIKNPTDDEPVG